MMGIYVLLYAAQREMAAVELLPDFVITMMKLSRLGTDEPPMTQRICGRMCADTRSDYDG